MNKNRVKFILLSVIALTVGAFFYFDLQRFASLEALKLQHSSLSVYAHDHTFLIALLFSLAYIIVTALSLPIASIFTLLAGALFGFPTGLLIASFASTIGATLAFLIARFILKEWVQNKYGSYLKKINDGFNKEGSFYLFALRIVPAFPFFMVNIAASILPIKIWTFYWVSQLGMLAGTAVYVYAGTQLGNLTSLSGIMSPSLLLSFATLGIFPIVAKKIITKVRQRKG
jgi:uncharacterized membrane protein YdjX (TVP38/TMEM64 family)